MARMHPPTRRRRKDARPGELIDAALAAFAQAGFGGTKIDDIAQRAGVAKGTVYRYFATKDELFEAVVRENITPLFLHLDAMIDDAPGSASDQLTAIVQRIYAELIDHPVRRAVMQILIAEGSRFPHLTEFYQREVLAKGKQILRKVIKHGVDSGEFRKTLAIGHPEVIMGPAILAAVWKMSFEQASPLNIQQFMKAHLDIVLNGLRSRSE
jgi:AcrR family transcriptional regulator